MKSHSRVITMENILEKIIKAEKNEDKTLKPENNCIGMSFLMKLQSENSQENTCARVLFIIKMIFIFIFHFNEQKIFLNNLARSYH